MSIEGAWNGLSSKEIDHALEELVRRGVLATRYNAEIGDDEFCLTPDGVRALTSAVAVVNTLSVFVADGDDV